MQYTTLAGSGCTLGATEIALTSFKGIEGTNLTMTAFGTKGYITLEPSNSTQEEQISFSGITQNANGTATLTGVKNVLFITPFTETSGTSKSHPGGSKAVVSNTSGFYNSFANKLNTETVVGLWTFPSSESNRPRIDSDVDTAVATALVTLGQLSRQAISGASNASTTVKGIVQLPSQSSVDNKSTTGGTGALFAVTPDKLRATKYNDYVADTGTATAYAIAPSPAVTQYVAGLEFTFKASHKNTGSATLAVNGLAAKTIKTASGNALLAGVIGTNSILGVVYDGTDMKLQSGYAISTVSTPGVVVQANSSGYIDGSFFSPIDTQNFTANGTWTKPANVRWVRVIAQGAGGGGGGKSGNVVKAGGGGGGARVEKWFLASDLASTETVVVGTGGPGGVGGNGGTTGGLSSFSSPRVVAGGGNGGLQGDSAANAAGSVGGSVNGYGNASVGTPAGGGLGGSMNSSGTAGQAEYGGGSGENGANAARVAGGASVYGGGGGGSSCSGQTGGSGGAGIAAGATGGGAGAAGGNGNIFGGGAGGGAGTADGATGGAGGTPGGGGGAAGCGASASGTGGAGGRGEVWVISY